VIYFLVLVILGFFLIKEVTAKRAAVFIQECMTPEEMTFILDQSAGPIKKEQQLALTKGVLGCVSSKQTAVERMVTSYLGADLFPK
jgi:hypothetical protein